MWRRIVSSHLKTLAADVAAASPRRSIATTTTARPVGFHRADNPASSSSVTPRCFSSESGVETIAKKKVEDVMPIATGHEKEELEAELEVGQQLRKQHRIGEKRFQIRSLIIFGVGRG
ncbi:hypothetical protein F2Q69_00031527 [Brassica cretica]|uniref:Uncharacterized protein n=1 Tax=Brassica cretica TaxID=69181 RepID=A0A8S9S0S2_BRACR|nr:hypothetical protein F2Q69_00031527 [Brassica cretica]